MDSKNQAQQKTIDRNQENATLELARLCARMAYECRAEDIRILHIENLCSYADYFVVATGSNRTQLKAIIERVEKAMEAKRDRQGKGGKGYLAGMGWRGNRIWTQAQDL